MSEHNGTNGRDAPGKTQATTPSTPAEGAEISAGPDSTTASSTTASIEYYILCPQRATEVPGLITHLISRDICEKRQSEHYHKCPNCVRSRVWRERNGLPVEEHAAAR
jgi:hypothetical protein